ncbi:MAG TPA: SurA N-terminal domain-containing protein [Candidatus Methanoperedens sp.]|nr:SurA N-terminal domain-containing protein [Candidatus Methanoperedens sp.]
MRAKSLVLLAAALAVTLVASAATAVVIDGIAAVVNGEIITLLELEKAGRAERPSQAPAAEHKQAQREQLRPVLEQLVLERLQAQRARELGIQVSAQEIDAAIAGVREENRLSEELLERLLQERGLSREEYRREILGQIRLSKLVRQEIGARTTVSDDEIAAYFAEHRQEWRRPEKIRVRHLLVPLPAEPSPAEVEEARAKATALRARTAGGADFADLVRAETPGAQPGVDPLSGEIARGELFPALEAAAFALPIGGISEPVRGPAGFHVVQVAEKTPAFEPQLAELRAGIEQKLVERKTRERYGAWIKQLRTNALIEIRY